MTSCSWAAGPAPIISEMGLRPLVEFTSILDWFRLVLDERMDMMDSLEGQSVTTMDVMNWFQCGGHPQDWLFHTSGEVEGHYALRKSLTA